MKALLFSVLWLAVMVASVLGLRWGGHDAFFGVFAVALILFVLSAGDWMKQRFGAGKGIVPAAVHALALLTFLLGVIAAVAGFDDPQYSFIDLLLPALVMPASVYLVFVFVNIVYG